VDHYVTRGQTLSEISRQYRVSATLIQDANPSLKPRALRVGQRLIIPMGGRIVPRSAWNTPVDPTPRRAASAGRTASHRVRSGETASQISRRYGVGLRALLDYNGLDMGSIIKPGQTLRLPSRGTVRNGQTE
jgi:membrane-bound lytic murein transglycosylase D